MVKLSLERHSYHPSATLGTIKGFGLDLASLELPWSNNTVSKSCIPEGYYLCRRFLSPTHGETWQVFVPNRTYILFHVANYPSELKGCIAVGLSLDESVVRVNQSRDAMRALRAALPDEFNLHIYQKRIRFDGI